MYFLLSCTDNTKMDKYEIRRQNLQRIVEQAGGPTAFARNYSVADADKPIDATYVSQIIMGHRRFGEKAAISMALRAGLPETYFDSIPDDQQTLPPKAAIRQERQAGFVRLQHLSPRPSMGMGSDLSEQIQVVQHLEVYEQWLREAVGSTDPKKIKVLTAVGRSMLPAIGDKDLVFVDISKKVVDAPGIYVIDVNQRLLLKKVMIQGNGTLIIRSENTAEFPDEERYPADQINETVHICGKVMAWWSLQKG